MLSVTVVDAMETDKSATKMGGAVPMDQGTRTDSEMCLIVQ